MMALQKKQTLSSSDVMVNMASSGSGSGSGNVQRVKNYDEIALPEDSYATQDELREIELANKKLLSKSENVKIFITNDKNFLDQYYELRNDIFRNERGWKNHEWFENEFDRAGKIVVAIDEDKKVIGGLRVMTSVNNDHLSDEFPGTEFVYPNLFDKMGLDKTLAYAEIDGVVVLKEHRNRYVMKEVVRVAAEYAESLNCAYLIGIAPLHICRNDRAVFRSIGYSEVSIAVSFPWKELEIYNNSKDFPIVGVLTSKKT